MSVMQQVGRTRWMALVSGFAVAMLPAGVQAATPTVVYSNLAGSSTSQIPGGLGTWDTDFSFFTLNVSPSGQYWLLNFQEENTNPEVLIAGSGKSGSAVLVEGVDGFSGRFVDGIDSSGRINDSGQWVVGGDFDGSTSDDDAIFGGALSGLTTLHAQEGAEIGGGGGAGAGNTWDALDTTAIDASGRAYWVSDSVDGPAYSSATNEVIVRSDFAVVAQKGVDVPGNQPGTPVAYDDFDLDDFHVSSDGVPSHCDGASAVSIGQKPGFTQRSKSTRISHHNVRQCERNEDTKLLKTKGTDNPADALTKGLPRHLNDKHVSCMCNMHTDETNDRPSSFAV